MPMMPPLFGSLAKPQFLSPTVASPIPILDVPLPIHANFVVSTRAVLSAGTHSEIYISSIPPSFDVSSFPFP